MTEHIDQGRKFKLSDLISRTLKEVEELLRLQSCSEAITMSARRERIPTGRNNRNQNTTFTPRGTTSFVSGYSNDCY